MLDFVPGTNQYYAMRVKFLAQGNNGGLKLTTDRHPPTTSQTCYSLRHDAPSINDHFCIKFWTHVYNLTKSKSTNLILIAIGANCLWYNIYTAKHNTLLASPRYHGTA